MTAADGTDIVMYVRYYPGKLSVEKMNRATWSTRAGINAVPCASLIMTYSSHEEVTSMRCDRNQSNVVEMI